VSTADAILAELERRQSADNRAGMARYGINVDNAYGVPVSALRRMAKGLGRDQALAQALWATGVHEARLLATIVAEPSAVSRDELQSWAGDLDSWDLTDGFTGNLVRQTPHAWACVDAWCDDGREFVRRAGFSLLAQLVVSDKRAGDEVFRAHLPQIRTAAVDERNMVKKSVNWALRQIGKRSVELNAAAIAEAEVLTAGPGKAARWIGRDALRELRSDKVQARLAARS